MASPANFDTTYFVLENPIITVLDTLLFITDLLINAGHITTDLP
jgi:hypothetical protein